MVTKRNSTRRPRKSKKSPQEQKPYDGFPLTIRKDGRLCKKIKGQVHLFGRIENWQEAIDKFQREREDLYAGRKPRQPVEPDESPDNRLTLGRLCNKFLDSKKKRLAAGELSPRSYADYERITDTLIAAFGAKRAVDDLLPEDFEGLRLSWSKRLGPVRLGNEINRVRVVFNWGHKKAKPRLLDKPMSYGEGFDRPSKKTLRLSRASKGVRMFEADELRKILKEAGRPLKAMILLGVNCGLGNNDVGRLPLSALDLEAGWLTYPRPKTGIARRCPLWPETVEAIREALKARPAPKQPGLEDRVFITKRGGSWAKDTADSPVSKEMRKLLDSLGINGHRNFYALRHTTETIGGESRDQIALDQIMGHARDDMASVYRERISDSRLNAVSDYIRNWLLTVDIGSLDGQRRFGVAQCHKSRSASSIRLPSLAGARSRATAVRARAHPVQETWAPSS